MSTKTHSIHVDRSTGTGIKVFEQLAADVATGVTDTAPIVLQQLKFARGQATTASASDTIVTGLATVAAVIVSLDSDPVDDPFMVSASIGDQAGSPTAGSFYLKTWKNTGGTDPTPLAATTFSKKVNWLAIGT